VPVDGTSSPGFGMYSEHCYYLFTPLHFTTGLNIVLYASFFLHLSTGLLGLVIQYFRAHEEPNYREGRFIVMNCLCAILGVIITVWCSNSLSLGQNGVHHINLLRAQLVCGIFKTILAFLGIKFHIRDPSYVQIQQEEVDADNGEPGYFQIQGEELDESSNTDTENDEPPDYDDIVPDFGECDGLPSYEEASEKAKRKEKVSEK